ncbi:MarR family transcriptional regulator [Niveispirillum sp. SYP-B3756]|uniref:MarR family winged helix-turn-helix transcriptional regulator n=1 Tax=Niveispirillum sp. SYP-B3756 TaxID=2662178 RepID=UPI0012916729|nr:MarR family transcriptional regulator [Niveispirillum sp. SYP-B3756]MQP68007.1 MarR family transcriptional regulator [Niveispirillum sp. SYP-B3756]
MTNEPIPLSLGSLLGETTRLMWRRFDQHARAAGSTRAQWFAMFKIAQGEGLKQAELAELLEIEPITLTRTIDRMVEGGWVERRADPGDRRARLLFLTNKARDAVAQMRLIANAIFDEALTGFSPAERETLLALLIRVRGNLSNTVPGSPVEEGKK